MWLVLERDPGKRILVVWRLPILHVTEDGVEELHALTREEAEVPDHARDAYLRSLRNLRFAEARFETQLQVYADEAAGFEREAVETGGDEVLIQELTISDLHHQWNADMSL